MAVGCHPSGGWAFIEVRRLCSVVGVAVFAACIVGCGGQQDGYGNTVAAYDTYGYAVDATGTRTDGPRYLRRTTAEVPDTGSPEEQLMLAVRVLLDEGGPASPGTTTYWEGICAPGHRPEGVEIRSDLVRVVEADGDTWETVADVSFIAPNERPTN